MVLSNHQTYASKKDSIMHYLLSGIARTTDWNRPYWADLHSTLIRAEWAFATNSSEYDWSEAGGEYRLYPFLHLGVDAPLWSNDFKGGRFGLNLTVPMFVEVWIDSFEELTAPLINTSYRVGAPEIGFIYRFKNQKHFKNIAVKFAPFKHESPHIGDELTIWRIEEGIPITRVNVSYNYTEFMVTLNDPDGTRERNHSVRAAIMILHNDGLGWYSILPEEGDITKVIPSHYPIEAYLQYQYQTRTSNNFQAIFSLEVRHRAPYNYPYYVKNEQGEWLPGTEEPNIEGFSINAFLGGRYNLPTKNAYFSKFGIGLRVYHGMNPHGQFRSHPNFTQVGASIIFE